MSPDSLLTCEARKLLGFTSPVMVMPAVRVDDIVRYCVAIDDMSPLYADEALKIPLPVEEIEAPPDFCQCYRFTNAPLSELAADGLPLQRDGVPRLPGPLQRVVYGGAEFEFRDAIRVGDRISVQSVITDIYERVGSKGPAIFSVVESTCTRQSGEIVTVMRTTNVYT